MKKTEVKKNFLYTTVITYNDEAVYDPVQIETCITNKWVVAAGILIGVCLIALILCVTL